MRWHSTAKFWLLCSLGQAARLERLQAATAGDPTTLRAYNDVRARLGTLDPALEAFQTWRLGIDFLTKQCQRPEFTPRHYKIVCPVLETIMRSVR
ncbi:hypothetical protein DMX11_15910 [Pseudomonas sp. LB-090624]|nr:hypothetical protein DMX11_15910 [Pseudomonas sp. LB-090624]